VKLHAGVVAIALAIPLLAVDDLKRPRNRMGCDPGRALLACDSGDRYECEWGRLLAGRGDVASLARVLDGGATELDGVLRALFPAIGDRPLVDEPLSVPAGLAFELPDYPRYEYPSPIDWAADPFDNVSWRFWFQSLGRLHQQSRGDAAAVDAGAALVADWVDRALYEIPPNDQTWSDFGIAVRLDRVTQLTERYLADRPVLNRRFLHAAAQLVVTHLYALAANCCYSAQHNHGTMQDLELLRRARQFPALRDGARMFELAGRRLLEEQVRRSVTRDGVHVENSGCYHRLYVDLVNNALVVYRDLGAPPPEELVRIRDAMLDPLVQHLQPDGTFAQFGDCSDERQTKRLRELLREIRDLGVGDPAAAAQLEWVVSDGRSGTMPPLDRVYELGGYAMFRDRWGVDATAAHFKTSHLSPVHYHADETGFEIFAHRRALLIGPGVFTYAEHDPLYDYQRSAAAQNVLVVDGDAGVQRELHDGRVLGHGRDGEASWVQGSHRNFHRLGVTSLVRTFAFVRPDTFVVVDHVRAGEVHDYAQHFHLAPELGEVSRAGDRAMVATGADGPSISIAAGSAEAIDAEPSWHFPKMNVKEASKQVVIRNRGQTVVLPVVIIVTAPGAPARVAEDVAYAEEGGVATVTWRDGAASHRLQVPAP
jgi:hypothetical protein